MDRRAFVSASGVGAAILGLPGLLDASEWTEVETANVKVVNDFLHARWMAEPIDWDKVASYLAEDCVWGTRTTHFTRGRDAIMADLRKRFGSLERGVRILQTFAIGPIVINDRLDSNRRPVVGVFEVRDGKIKEWRAFGK